MPAGMDGCFGVLPENIPIPRSVKSKKLLTPLGFPSLGLARWLPATALWPWRTLHGWV